jgi:5-methylcytosine-specific restriction endonuclease McrA
MKCHSCQGVRSKHTRYCLRCYIKEAVRKTLGIRDNEQKEQYANLLYKKLANQNFTCVYTGRRLIPGQNMSLDHILPKSLFPEIAADIDNLVWVDLSCNIAKNNLLPGNFLEICQDVVRTSSPILYSK